ncbi:MAG TPA: type VI secretion system baseplate subunit TssE [Tepidisphaeraceae bacterium]|jgi:type VI secretion system protein ImpF
MPELAPKARLQPSLLDRLLDDEPGAVQESRDRRVLSLPQLRTAVLRDLIWLLNTSCQSPADLDGLREVERSVLNYGVPSLAGRMLSGLKVLEIEQAITRAIERYEPRILARSLRVHVVAEQATNRPNQLVMEIEGDLWAQPLPESLYIRTAVDLETGHFTLEERR